MTLSPTQIVDCRGQQCPAPILATARAARQLQDSGGTLEILADDDAFPLDMQSWCRSSGSQLVSLTEDSGTHRALVRIGDEPEARPSRPAALVERTSSAPPLVIDCRGMECPQPILQVARAARKDPGAALEVLADDDAFELDIKSWCRSAQAELVDLERIDGVFRAKIQLVRASTSAPVGALPPARASAPLVVSTPTEAPRVTDGSEFKIDLSNVPEGRRVAELDRTLRETRAGKLTVLLPDRRFTATLAQWCEDGNHELTALSGKGPVTAEIELASASTAIALASPTALAEVRQKRASFLVLHNDKEALLAALLVANGAAAQGMDVTMFFTFWGLNLLRGDLPNPAHAPEKVTWAQRLFKWLMPRGPKRQSLGKLNFGGMGAGMLNGLMRRKNIMDLPELLESAQEQDIRFIACTMSMNVMGITKRDLHPYSTLEYGGVATFVEASEGADLSLVF
ncbi:MAG: sulfurtransferase TusA family protein [Sandaracinaceae bacterium]